MFDAWAENVPANTKLKVHGPIEAHLEPLISTCECGGSFRSNAPPRCPLCSAPLSADAATAYIERNAEGTAKGWRWDRTWSGIYCMDVEKKAAKNPWLAQGT